MAYSFPADVWAAGVMLYWMFCRDFPFTGKNTVGVTGAVALSVVTLYTPTRPWHTQTVGERVCG